jgi:hypothetical protein
MRRFQVALTPIVLAVLNLCTGSARAEGEATCDRLRAEARSEAAILYAPRIELEVAHVPSIATPSDLTASAFHGTQGRAALALSPIDMLRGRAIERVADAECERDRIARQLDRVLALGTRSGELAAANAELEYLDAHLGEIDALVDDAVARLGRQRATAVEVAELRTRRASLRRRVAELRLTQVELRELGGEVAPSGDLEALVSAYRGVALRADSRRADVRAWSAWRVDVRAGAAAADRTDWYAIVDLGYSFGQPWQRAAEQRAARAREREYAGDDREVARLEELARALRGSVGALDEELRVIDDEIALRRSEQARLTALDTEPAQQLRAHIMIELVELGARRVSLATLIGSRRAIIGTNQGRGNQ